MAIALFVLGRLSGHMFVSMSQLLTVKRTHVYKGHALKMSLNISVQ